MSLKNSARIIFGSKSKTFKKAEALQKVSSYKHDLNTILPERILNEKAHCFLLVYPFLN